MKKNKGIALILVISTLALLSIMMVEFTSGSQMNFRIANNFKNAAKSRHLARSGIYFALLELKIFKTIKENPLVKQIPGFNEGMLDQLWQFGFIYPPLATKKTTFGAEKAIKELAEVSKIDGKIRVDITDESAKINLNALRKSESRAGISRQLENIFERKKSSDEEFFDKYRDLRFGELVEHIVDWIDKDNEKTGGGSEDNYYGRLPTPYKPKNAPLDTISELQMIEGFDNSEIFDLLLPYVTVYPTEGVEGVNVNTADASMLLSISSELTEEDVKKIIEHRETTRFKKSEEFEQFCKNTLLKSADFNRNPRVPLSTTSEIFSLVSTAEVRGTLEVVRAVVNISKTMPDGSPAILYWNTN